VLQAALLTFAKKTAEPEHLQSDKDTFSLIAICFYFLQSVLKRKLPQAKCSNFSSRQTTTAGCATVSDRRKSLSLYQGR